MKQMRGLRMIIEDPKRGRIFVARQADRILGMINLLFVVSTAAGGMSLILDDVVIYPDLRGQGLGAMLLEHAIEFAKEKKFLRITLLSEPGKEDQARKFFTKYGFIPSRMQPMRLAISEEPA
jgi:GNAT superfamily N-acetyltransferase